MATSNGLLKDKILIRSQTSRYCQKSEKNQLQEAVKILRFRWYSTRAIHTIRTIRYGFYVGVTRTVSHWLAQQRSEIELFPLEYNIHICKSQSPLITSSKLEKEEICALLTSICHRRRQQDIRKVGQSVLGCSVLWILFLKYTFFKCQLRSVGTQLISVPCRPIPEIN